MILNDKPNCQVSRILMNPRPILSDSSENDPETNYIFFFSNLQVHPQLCAVNISSIFFIVIIRVVHME
jgi:hypothetical protein